MCDTQLIRGTNARAYDYLQGNLIWLPKGKEKKNLPEKHWIISILRFSSGRSLVFLNNSEREKDVDVNWLKKTDVSKYQHSIGESSTEIWLNEQQLL